MGFGPARRSYRYRNKKHSNRWRQIGISACVLLVPPVAICAAAYAMLPQRGDSVAIERAASGKAPTFDDTRVPATTTASIETASSAPQGPLGGARIVQAGRTVGSMPAAGAGSVDPVEAEAVPPAALPTDGTGTASYALANAAREPGQKDLARIPVGPVPVHVTVVTAPNSGAAAVEDEPDSETVAQPSRPRSDALFRASGSVVDLPADAQGLRMVRGRLRSYIRHLVHRSAIRSEVREARAARWQANPQREISLHGFLQQLGSRRGSQRADASGARPAPR